MKTFLHGGDFGDLIYALPAIRALGGGVLYLSEAHPGREPLTAARRDVLLPLLERIDYLADVRVHHGRAGRRGFHRLPQHLRPGEINLARAQLACCGLPLDLAEEAWIDRTVFGATGSVLRGGDSSLRALSKSEFPLEDGGGTFWAKASFLDSPASIWISSRSTGRFSSGGHSHPGERIGPLPGSRFPREKFSASGSEAHRRLDSPEWDAYLTDPFHPQFGPYDLDQWLVNHLRSRIGAGAARNHRFHGDNAEQALIALVQGDMTALGQDAATFRYFLSFSFEVFDSYGRFLAFINRNQPGAAAAGPPRPASYNERLLQMGAALPVLHLAKHRSVPPIALAPRRRDRSRHGQSDGGLDSRPAPGPRIRPRGARQCEGEHRV